MAAAVWMAAALLLAIDLHAANPVADLRVAAAEDAGGNTTFFFTASTGSSRLYVTNAFEYYMTIGTERITGHGVSLRCGGEWHRSGNSPNNPAGNFLQQVGVDLCNGTHPVLGDYTGVTATWIAPSCSNSSSFVFSTSIYNFPTYDLLQFVQNVSSGSISNTSVLQLPPAGSRAPPAPTATLVSEFPIFQLANRSSGGAAPHSGGGGGGRGMLTYAGSLIANEANFTERIFRPPQPDLANFTGGMGAGPLLLFGFDGAAHPTDSLVFGVGSSFYAAALSKRVGSNDMFAAGAHGYIAELPHNWSTALNVVGAAGINAAMHGWGAAARAQHGLDTGGPARRLTLDEDPLSRKLSYLQDNGAYYCYCKLVGKSQYIGNRTFPEGPVAPAHVVMNALHQHFKATLGFAMGVYHIDPYWYAAHELWCGATEFSGTCMSFNASTFHFPAGIKTAIQGLPMQLYMSHTFSNTSQLHYPGYQFTPADWPSGDLQASVAPKQAFRFWDSTFAYHVSQSNLKALTLDQLPAAVYAFASLSSTAGGAAVLQQGYADAAFKHGLPIRTDWCTPSLALASLQQGAWVTARANGDATPTTTQGTFEYSGDTRESLVGASALLSALHLRPMMDVLWTSEQQPGDPYNCGNTFSCSHPALFPGKPCCANNANGPPSTRLNLGFDLAVAVLTCGPVGIGDKIGLTNRTLLMRALKSDGTILKPAHPFLRLDAFFQHAQSDGGDDGSSSSIVGDGGNGSGSRQQPGAGPGHAQLWVAASVPARFNPTTLKEAEDTPAAATDRRANSMVRLAPVGRTANVHGVDRRMWYYTVLASRVPKGARPTVKPADLWPTPSPGASFLVGKSFGSPTSLSGVHSSSSSSSSSSDAAFACSNGSAVHDCFAVFDASFPLRIDAGGSVGKDGRLIPYQLYALAPIFPSGFALIGEIDKIVAMSPQRFGAGHRASDVPLSNDATSRKPPSTAASDALDPVELSGPQTNGGEPSLTFHVYGAAREMVRVTVIVPSPTVHAFTPRERAMSGRVLQLNLTFPVAGNARVVCTAACSVAYTFA